MKLTSTRDLRGTCSAISPIKNSCWGFWGRWTLAMLFSKRDIALRLSIPFFNNKKSNFQCDQDSLMVSTCWTRNKCVRSQAWVSWLKNKDLRSNLRALTSEKKSSNLPSKRRKQTFSFAMTKKTTSRWKSHLKTTRSSSKLNFTIRQTNKLSVDFISSSSNPSSSRSKNSLEVVTRTSSHELRVHSKYLKERRGRLTNTSLWRREREWRRLRLMTWWSQRDRIIKTKMATICCEDLSKKTMKNEEERS